MYKYACTRVCSECVHVFQMYCHSSLYLNTHRGIGCIFVEMLTGKPLFPGMKVHNGHVHVRVAPEACSLGKVTALGVLCCYASFVC